MINPSEIKRGKQYSHNNTTVTVERKKDNSTALVWVGDKNDLDNLIEVKIEDLKAVNGKRSPIKPTQPKQTSEMRAKQGDLNDFFDRMAINIPFHCENCRKPLYAVNKFERRCCTAHIFPKSKFESIVTNELNIVYLGESILAICDCHGTWDNMGADERKKMPVYGLALRRLEALKPFLTDKELIQANKYLGI